MQSEEEHQEHDHNHHLYPQPDPLRGVWRALQDLRIGADRARWSIHEEVQEEFEKDHNLCLVANGLNPYHQNALGIKVYLPRTWQLVGKVEGQINDDDTVSFYFDNEHHLLMVLDKQPYSYRGWLVAIDRWTNRDKPTFLKKIPFKVRILKLPNVYRRHSIVENIGSKLGYVEEVTIVEPTAAREARVSVKVQFDIDDEITLTREVEIIKNKPPVKLDFRYIGLQKFCLLCGSLKHEYELCHEYPKLKQHQIKLMDKSTNPYASVQERNDAIGEYISTMEIGESSGTAVTTRGESSQIMQPMDQEGVVMQEATNQEQSLIQEVLGATTRDQGTKTKSPEDKDNTSLQHQKKKLS